ncbi:hypothetical protein Lser_V15G06658 [Lactuca serriola]
MKNRNFAPLASRLHLLITFGTSALETQIKYFGVELRIEGPLQAYILVDVHHVIFLRCGVKNLGVSFKKQVKCTATKVYLVPMAPKQPNTGLFVGLNKGHVVTKKELAPRPSDRKGGFQLLSDDIDITMLVTNVQPDDHKLEELVVREVYQTFKEFPMIYMMDCTENDCSSLLKSSTKCAIENEDKPNCAAENEELVQYCRTMVNSQDSYAQPVAVAATHGVVDVYQAYGGAASGQTLPVQVLFKNLNVDLKEVSPSSLLMDKVREVEGSPDFSNKMSG